LLIFIVNKIRMFKEIPKSDIVVRPFKVYKEWKLDETNTSIKYGVSASFGAFDADIDGDAGILYRSIRSQFYLNSSTASIITEVGRRKSYASTDERILGDEFSLIAISQYNYGEGIKVGSVKLTDNNINSVYTDDGFSNLVSGSKIYGNIFYDRGLIVMTSGSSSQSGSMTDFLLEYNSTQTIYENEIFLSVLENEFNTSQNPTAVYTPSIRRETIQLKGDKYKRSNDANVITISTPDIQFIRTSKYPFTSSIDSDTFASFDDYMFSSSVDPTGSYLAPYITTIGLYDNNNQMVAVAKLAHPIKSYPDYPLNFIIRFDT
jgi:hypothetical protein